MKNIIALVMLMVSVTRMDASIFSSAFNHIKDAVTGGVSKVTGAGTNDQAVKQLESVIAQYQSALQQEQAELAQEQSVIAQEQQIIQKDTNLLRRCTVESAIYLQLLPHAPPLTSPDLYNVLVLEVLKNVFDPLASADVYAALRSAFTVDDLKAFAKTLAPLTDAQMQAVVMNYTLPNGTTQCDVVQLAQAFITGISNIKPGDPSAAYLTKSALTVDGFKSWCWNLTTNWWHGSSGCSPDLCAGAYNAILPHINPRFCNANQLGQTFLAAWKNLKPGVDDAADANIRKSGMSVDGFKAWAWNLSTDWWHGSTGCSQDIAAQVYDQIKNQLTLILT